MDAECPGFGGDPANRFCVAGACVGCRDTGDCQGTTPVCDANTCRACAAHDECPTSVCGSDGACVDSSEIAYVSAAGSPNTDCAQAAPCTLPRAVALSARKYILIASGTYTNAGTVDVGGVRWLIGTGATRPRITNSGTGPVFRVLPGSDTRWENLELFGAKSSGANRPYGSGLDAYDTGTGSRTITLLEMLLAGNDYAGVDCQSCTMTASRSSFMNNVGAGVWSNNATLNIDRSTFSGNGSGVYMYNGLHKLTNSWFVRNTETGIEFCRSGTLTAEIEFSTIADNGMEAIKSCSDAAPVFQNDLIARHPMLVSGTLSATYSGTIIATDITPLKFKSPDQQPYDYHLTAGSSAIDQAVSSSVDHDADGQPRPLGAAADVGADELE